MCSRFAVLIFWEVGAQIANASSLKTNGEQNRERPHIKEESDLHRRLAVKGDIKVMMIRSATALFLFAAFHCRGASAAVDAGLPTKDDLLVRGLDEIEPAFGLFEGNMYAGRLPVKNGNREGQMMFWLFAPAHPSSPDSVQLWVRCSLVLACFMRRVIVASSFLSSFTKNVKQYLTHFLSLSLILLRPSLCYGR